MSGQNLDQLEHYSASDVAIMMGFLNDCKNVEIRNPAILLSEKRPQLWGDLKGAFPRGILPTDIDGEVEISGRFLRLEVKHEKTLRAEPKMTGQYRALSALVESKLHSVLWIGQNYDRVWTCYKIWHGDKKGELHEATMETIRQRCEKWANWAKEQGGLNP